MINIVRADLFRMRKSKMFKASILMCTISAIVIAVLLYLAAQGTVSEELTTKFSLIVDSFLIYFLGSMLIGSHITKDYESKTIHDEIASGNGRISIVAAKFISSSIMIAMITLPYALTAIIGFCLNIKFATYVGIPSVFFTALSNSAGLAVSFDNIVTIILLCLVMVVVYMARLCIIIPFAFKTKKVIPVTIIGIVCSFVFDLILALGKDVEGIARTIKLLPYGVTYDLSLEAGKGKYGIAVLVSVVFILVVLFNTNRMFRNQEIK